MLLDEYTNKNILVSLNKELEVNKVLLNKEYLEKIIDKNEIWLLEKELEEVIRDKVIEIIETIKKKTDNVLELKEFLANTIKRLKMNDYKKILESVFGDEEIAKKEYSTLLEMRKTFSISTQEFISYEIDPIYTNEVDSPYLRQNRLL